VLEHVSRQGWKDRSAGEHSGRRTLPKAVAFWILPVLFLMLFLASVAASCSTGVSGPVSFLGDHADSVGVGLSGPTSGDHHSVGLQCCRITPRRRPLR
jgi:hypothetical protein